MYLMCLTTDYFNELFECRLPTIKIVFSCCRHTNLVRWQQQCRKALGSWLSWRGARQCAGVCQGIKAQIQTTLPSRLKGQVKQSKLNRGCFKTRHSLWTLYVGYYVKTKPHRHCVQSRLLNVLWAIKYLLRNFSLTNVAGLWAVNIITKLFVWIITMCLFLHET